MKSYRQFRKKAQEDVWELETSAEDIASDDLSSISQKAIGGDKESQDFLTKIWDDESWDSIKEKLETEGSVWYVWWMDGVHKLMATNK